MAPKDLAVQEAEVPQLKQSLGSDYFLIEGHDLSVSCGRATTAPTQSFFVCNGELMRASLSAKAAALAILAAPLSGSQSGKRSAYKVQT